MLPEVQAALRQISEAMPKWQNLNEQMLALRLNNYDTTATIEWKHSEVEHGGTFETLTLRDAILIKSLEEGLRKKSQAVADLKKRQKASEVCFVHLGAVGSRGVERLCSSLIVVHTHDWL